MAAMPAVPSLTRFLRDEQGSVSVEALLMFPVLAWTFLSVFVFFDAFRDKAATVRAAYTIGDMLSREKDDVTPEVLDSLYSLQGTLGGTSGPRSLRITAFSYEESDNSFDVHWSRTQGNVAGELTDAGLANLRDRLPIMVDGASAVLTETWVGHQPVFAVGIKPLTFQNFVVTNLRFTPRLCWNSVNDGGGPTTRTC